MQITSSFSHSFDFGLQRLLYLKATGYFDANVHCLSRFANSHMRSGRTGSGTLLKPCQFWLCFFFLLFPVSDINVWLLCRCRPSLLPSKHFSFYYSLIHQAFKSVFPIGKRFLGQHTPESIFFSLWSHYCYSGVGYFIKRCFMFW
jgi:hypothetical protein